MTRFLTRDVDTTLEFDNQAGLLALEGVDNDAAIELTPQAAINLASALLQYGTRTGATK